MHRFLWLIAPLALALDRGSKALAQSRLQNAPPVEIWPGVFRFSYVENTGAAFGMLSGQQWLLLVITGAALLGLLIWLILRGGRLPAWVRAACWLMLGGALGNFYDRLAQGAVIDFLQITLFEFPVFNVADICVCIAFALLALWLLLGGKEVASDA
ncbi:MAG: signal peptidase II [Oscillospiraceae bacterium]|jgi:signal peptidase II|nr:signal peptidase II [Oscillospiraceae bacterium]